MADYFFRLFCQRSISSQIVSRYYEANEILEALILRILSDLVEGIVRVNDNVSRVLKPGGFRIWIELIVKGNNNPSLSTEGFSPNMFQFIFSGTSRGFDQIHEPIVHFRFEGRSCQHLLGIL
jgi:hypothetical protein